MASINKVILAGRLTRDPELKEVKPGINVCKFSIATEFVYKSKGGPETKDVCFTEVAVWFKLAELCGASLKKGSLVTVEGRLKQEKWTDKTGTERSKHIVSADTVVFMEPRLAEPKTVEPANRDLNKLLDNREAAEAGNAWVDELPF
jgi:single-strand DNA-binding protein